MDNVLTAIIIPIITALLGVLGGVLGTILQYKLTHRRIADKDLFFAWRVAFDRYAFLGAFKYDTGLVGFQRAISDVTLAVNTGAIRNAPGQGGGAGKVFINDLKRREKMEDVSRLLHRIKEQAEKPVSSPEADNQRKASLDADRLEIIKLMNELWKPLGIPTLPVPDRSLPDSFLDAVRKDEDQ